MRIIEKPVKEGNLVLDPKLYAKFIHPDSLRNVACEFNEGESKDE